ncbi:LPS export ABC transporter periplasmic protein LptC [Pseudodonghicola flavimaris]|uniref:LPS export ABC transporter periplasmic protein LptC n=1 Tax=Pseudodonghicola flavimaris TaxID=3050036 RepID=A0ABT7EX50_9RHOB|nr:LPS export ABC transporter periplasmic protein LptC [Pseudodonghicola flavimaris]MDK3016917.1 LPS export ABC transporter periplasmic protein LptC [Pseudodonghicola flavimaris]
MDRHSRLVTYFKVILPLAALVLLSTLFLLSRGTTPTATVPFAQKDMEERMRGQQITGPFFSGITDGGDEITVSASVAHPAGDGGMADAQDLRAHMTLSKGGDIRLEAATGSLDIAGDQARFEGDVKITTSTGYTVTTDHLDAGIGTLSARTPGAVQASGPFGDFTAGQMQIGAKNKDAPVHMLFTKGVKLIYDPQQSRDE